MLDGSFDIKLEKPVQEAVAKTDPKNVTKAMFRTLNRIQKRARTMAYRGLSRQYHITQKLAKAQMRVPLPRTEITKTGALFVSIQKFKSNRIGLQHFPTKEKWVMSRPRRAKKPARRRAVFVKVLRQGGYKMPRREGDEEFKGFVGRGRAGPVRVGGARLIFARERFPRHRSRKDRLPVTKLTTIAPAQMLISKYSRRLIDQMLDRDFAKEFVNNMNYYQNIRGGGR